MRDELLTLLAVLLIFVIVPLSPAMLLAVLLQSSLSVLYYTFPLCLLSL